MRRTWFVVIGVLLLAAVVGASVIFVIGRNMLMAFQGAQYPKAPPMPAAVPDKVEDLLARFEQLLDKQAPKLLAALQPGLSRERIEELEKQHQFKLPPDLRALYHWRNGTPRNNSLDIFPDHRFVPLDEAAAEREELRRQVKEGNPLQRGVWAAFAGHREAWLGLIVDAAGDGYFFDPGRAEDEGSFFFNFAEDGSFIFFPAFRNVLKAVVEGHEAGFLRFGARGAETADFNRQHALWQRYGALAAGPNEI